MLAHHTANFVRHKTKRLASSTTGSRYFWFTEKTISCNFCSTNSPPIRNSSDSDMQPGWQSRRFFLSVYLKLNFSATPTFPSSFFSSHTFFPFITTGKIRQVLSELNISKHSGLDGIPPIVLKMCSEVIPYTTPSLSFISYPKCFLYWRLQSFSPSHSMKNLLISRVLGAVIFEQLHPFPRRKGLLNDQYGFHSRRSTGDLLPVISHSWSAALDCRRGTHLVSLTIFKAFNLVWHEGLLWKFSSFGFHPALLSCFLSRRLYPSKSLGFYQPFNLFFRFPHLRPLLFCCL